MKLAKSGCSILYAANNTFGSLMSSSLSKFPNVWSSLSNFIRRQFGTRESGVIWILQESQEQGSAEWRLWSPRC